jgi:CRISPR-associated protein Csb2
MLAIQIVFPWGRYYAHPWGLNPVRLREAEWPPSPWRLLRALASSWFRANPGMAPNGETVALIESLGRVLPEIGIGKVAFGQTVHYQPNYGEAKTGKPEVVAARMVNAEYKNTRHENHFAAVHGPVIFRWSSISLSPPQEVLLASLLADLSYFGRSESICQAELVTSNAVEDLPDIGWCHPTGSRRIAAHYRDVFCPKADFQITDLWARRTRDGSPAVESPDAPKHLVDALLATDMKADGAQWISYEMPADWPGNRVIRTPRSIRQERKPLNDGPRIAHYLRFSLQCRVPVPPKFTVRLAEEFREEASRRFSTEFDAQRSFALFGHSKDRPKDAAGEHQHAFYLPTQGFGDDESLDQRGMITELHVWCPYGFTRAETQVLLGVQRLVWKDGRYPVRPVLTAMSKEAPGGLPLATGNVKSRIWRSETPFVPPRYCFRGDLSRPKMKDAESPERQLIGCLEKVGIKTSGEVRRLALSGLQLAPTESLPPMPLWSIVRAPGGEGTPLADGVVSPTHTNGSKGERAAHQQRIGFFMEIRFESEVALPMPALGHSNHFGLGLFLPAGG